MAVGTRIRSDLLQAGIGSSERFGIMPPGVSLGGIPSKLKLLEDFGLDNSLLYCGFVGRVTKIKRPNRFLGLVSEMKKRGNNLAFFVAGEGELLDYCKKRISAESLPVTLLGWQLEVEKVFSAADMILLTSDNEGVPLSLIQAGMVGLPGS